MPELAQQEVRVRVEDDTGGIYIGSEAIDAIRAEANRQCDEATSEFFALWNDLDVEDLDAIKEAEAVLDRAQSALATLRYLAPIKDDDDA